MLNRENFYFLSQSSQIWLQINGIKVRKNIQNFSSISLKLCQLSKKKTGTWGVNTTIAIRINCYRNSLKQDLFNCDMLSLVA